MSGFATSGTGSDEVLNEQSHSNVDHTGILGVGGAGGDAFPIGAIVPFGALVSSIPAGWLACDGSEYGRTGGDPNPEPDLFGIIGVAWGVGDGVNTFNVPDLRHRSLTGLNDGTLPAGTDGGFTSRSLAALAGAENHSHTVNSHTHTIGADGSHTHSGTTQTNNANISPGQPATFPGNDGINSLHTHPFVTGTPSPSTHSHGGVTGGESPPTSNNNGFGPTAFCPFIIKAQQLGGGAGGVSGQSNAGALQGPQPTINFQDGTNTTVTVTENIPQNRLDVAYNATGGGFVICLGATAASNDFFIVNGDSNRTGQNTSDHSVRATIPVASTSFSVGWSANGADTISFRRNGAFVESFVVANGQGVFTTAATAFAAGDYLELRSSGGVVAQFQCYFTA